MELSDTYLDLENKLKDGKITPMEFVEEYNRRMDDEEEKHDHEFRPHEHI